MYIRLGLAPIAFLFAGAAGAATPMTPFVTPAGALRLVDPEQPIGAGNPFTVDTGLTVDEANGARGLLAASLSGTTGSNLRTPLLVYTKGGQIFKVSTVVGVSNAPVRVSSISDACEISHRTEDFSNVNRSRLLVRRAGGDAACNSTDDTQTSIKVSAGTSASGPTPVGLLSIDAVYGAGGAIAGFLTLEGASPAIKHRDLNFASPVTVLPLANTGVQRYEVTLRQIFIRATRANQADVKLWRYDQGTNGTTVSAPLHTFTGGTDHMGTDPAFDADNLYFADGNRLMRTPVAATAASQTQVVARAPVGENITEISVSAGSSAVVFATSGANFTGGVYAAPKTANNVTATPLRVNNLAQGKLASLAAVGGNLAYINFTNFLTETITAVMINNDGTGAVNTANAYFAGATLPSTVDLLASEPQDAPAFVMRASKGAGFDTVRLLGGADGSNRKIMGDIASTVSMQAIFGFGVSRFAGVAAFIDRGGDVSDADLFMFDTSVSGSMRTVSATVGGDDIAVGGF